MCKLCGAKFEKTLEILTDIADFPEDDYFCTPCSPCKWIENQPTNKHPERLEYSYPTQTRRHSGLPPRTQSKHSDSAVNALYLSVTDTYSQGEHGRVAAVPRTSVNVNVYNRQKPAWGGSAARWAVGVDVRSRSALKKSGQREGHNSRGT